MKRSTVIVGLLICAGVYLFGREHREAFTSTRSAPPQPQTVLPIPAAPRTAAEAVAPSLPDPATRLARLKREYRDHAGFRQLVANYNTETGHPGRGEIASLQALDQDAVAGAPVFGLMQAVQPRAEMTRAFERHWRDERRRREDGTTDTQAQRAIPTTP